MISVPILINSWYSVKLNFLIDLFDFKSPQLVQHPCSARMIWNSNKVIIIIIIIIIIVNSS